MFLYSFEIVCDYYDSYGNDLNASYGITIPWKIHWQNTRRQQQLHTTSCGAFCIYFLSKRASGLSPDQIVRGLGATPKDSEIAVAKFMCKTEVRHCIKEGQSCKSTIENGY